MRTLAKVFISLIVAGVALVVLGYLAPLIVLGTIALAAIAWLRPDAVAFLTDARIRSRLPYFIGRTPFRVALLIAMVLIPVSLVSATALSDARRSGGTRERSEAARSELVVEFPRNGVTVDEAVITVSGSAPPGAVVVHDIPWALDTRVAAGDDGSWSMPVELDEGRNELGFRVDGTRLRTTLVVTYERASAVDPPTPTPTRTPTPTPSPEPEPVPSGPPQAVTADAARVLSVTDGDTITVAADDTVYDVRYIGIDAPETTGDCFAAEATAANRQLVEDRLVSLESDVSEVDRFGRLLRYVWIETADGWLMVNRALVQGGFAFAQEYPPDVRYADVLEADEAGARASGAGMWSACGAAPTTPVPAPGGECDPSYPDVCIPPPPPDLDCGDISFRRFRVLAPDPHGFDGNSDGVGCESD